MLHLYRAHARTLICFSFFLLGAQTDLRAVGISDIFLRLDLTLASSAWPLQSQL